MRSFPERGREIWIDSGAMEVCIRTDARWWWGGGEGEGCCVIFLAGACPRHQNMKQKRSRTSSSELKSTFDRSSLITETTSLRAAPRPSEASTFMLFMLNSAS